MTEERLRVSSVTHGYVEAHNEARQLDGLARVEFEELAPGQWTAWAAVNDRRLVQAWGDLAGCFAAVRAGCRAMRRQ